MESLFTSQFQWLWTLALALALFVPVRNLIWVVQQRRALRKLEGGLDEVERERLKKRAAVTSGLLCFVFSVLYVNHLFQGQP